MTDTLRYPFDRTVATEPPPEFDRLRELSPVTVVTMPTGDQAYLVTRFADVEQVLSDPRFSVDRNRPGAARPVAMSRDDSMMAKDPPEHSRLRRLVSGSFTRARVNALLPRITEQTDTLISALLSAGPPADLHEQLAVPLPLAVISALLGIPPADHPQLRQWSERMVSLTGYPPEEVLAARTHLRDYLAELVRQKRRAPGPDLTSAMVLARDEQDRLSESELISQVLLLLVAGHETTTRQIGNGAVALLTHASLAELADDEALDAAVEEMLRFAPPGDGAQFRIATTDVEIAGCPIPAGSAVLAPVASANRDRRQFCEPDRFDPGRTDPGHVTFGHGAHFCLGAPLARLELRVVFGALARRMPNLALAVDPAELRWRRGLRISGYEQIPVRW